MSCVSTAICLQLIYLSQTTVAVPSQRRPSRSPRLTEGLDIRFREWQYPFDYHCDSRARLPVIATLEDAQVLRGKLDASDLQGYRRLNDEIELELRNGASAASAEANELGDWYDQTR